MSLYNVIFTVLPPLVIGIFDQDVDRETSRLYPGGLHMHSNPLIIFFKGVKCKGNLGT